MAEAARLRCRSATYPMYARVTALQEDTDSPPEIPRRSLLNHTLGPHFLKEYSLTLPNELGLRNKRKLPDH